MTENISHFDPLFSRLIKNLWITPRRHHKTGNFRLETAKNGAAKQSDLLRAAAGSSTWPLFMRSLIRCPSRFAVAIG